MPVAPGRCSYPCLKRLLLLGIPGCALLLGSIPAWGGTLGWLVGSIDTTRAHSIDAVSSWHARLMVLAWGVALPTGVVIARFFKIWPGQEWPNEVNNQKWWHSHLFLQWGGSVLAVGGLLLILLWGGHQGSVSTSLHRFFGWMTMAGLVIQVIGGLGRGTTGGPEYAAENADFSGDHYNMTPRRKAFEYVHKYTGYIALLFGCLAILQGLWIVNAPRWMWAAILAWWIILLAFAVVLQRKGRTIDTYQAIWGPDPKHPGNHLKPIGLGINRREK